MSRSSSEQPIPDAELDAARHAMSPTEDSASDLRERYFYQPKEALELSEPLTTPEGDRIPPTPEQVEIMDRRLGVLNAIVGNSTMDWQLDGGLAISAYAGEYQGYHKDIDISISPDDVPELERRGLEHGYGLFIGDLPRDSNGEVQYAIRPANQEQFLRDRHHRFLIRVDEQGEIQHGGDLDFIDVHIRPVNAEGRELGVTSVPLPEAWDETTMVDFHDAKLRLPSLAEVAYFKLYAARPIDLGDLRAIARNEHFSVEQYIELETMVEAERNDKIESMRNTLEKLAAEFSPAMSANEAENFLAEDEGNWTLDYNWDGKKALGALFFGTAQKDLEMAKEQTLNAMINTMAHEREDRLVEMKQYLRPKLA